MEKGKEIETEHSNQSRRKGRKHHNKAKPAKTTNPDNSKHSDHDSKSASQSGTHPEKSIEAVYNDGIIAGGKADETEHDPQETVTVSQLEKRENTSQVADAEGLDHSGNLVSSLSNKSYDDTLARWFPDMVEKIPGVKISK